MLNYWPTCVLWMEIPLGKTSYFAKTLVKTTGEEISRITTEYLENGNL